VNAEKETLVRYRFARARESHEEAKALYELGHMNACVNRLYYAAFYAISAALLAMDKSSTKHSGVRALFHRHLVRTGRVPVEMGKLVDKLFDSRQRGDYADLVRFEATEVSPWFSPTERLIGLLESSTFP
jgi:uncharacterized protein (UPF0332 family)